MGYYSHFEIVADGTKDVEVLSEIAEALAEISGYDFNVVNTEIHSADHYKWYAHGVDLTTLSKRYPDTTFQLRAIGEDGDRWVFVARNGRSYQENVTPSWPPVDESMLTA